MMALASEEELGILINDPVESNCLTVSAHGIIPVVYPTIGLYNNT
jgi:hypothetical protein